MSIHSANLNLFRRAPGQRLSMAGVRGRQTFAAFADPSSRALASTLYLAAEWLELDREPTRSTFDRKWQLSKIAYQRLVSLLPAQLLSLCNAARANFECLLQARAAVPPVAPERQDSPTFAIPPCDSTSLSSRIGHVNGCPLLGGRWARECRLVGLDAPQRCSSRHAE